ncbi:hypothetical protein RIR_jg42613.t1 [Rhizophagus irregularis DAOM 181602=DAOM 197198]|nr:hypothetical protein RIR_jg42613.t1 [Rhizophagus irregularis DAOM 181602=DAOM 197198]
MQYSRIATLPTRFDIKELQYSGARFSRGAIARLGQTLQTRFPDRKFQILLPYENWKPGGWTSGNQPASLFSLLDIMMKHNYRMTQTLIILNDS